MKKEQVSQSVGQLGRKDLEKTKANLVKMNERAVNRLRRMKEIREAVEVSC